MIERFSDEYRFLSNFYPSPIMYEGIYYKSVESAYQSAKTLDISIRMTFSDMNPKDAKQKGRELVIRDDWDKVKVHVMYACLKEKFRDRVLMKKLLSTGDEIIVEGNHWHDNFFGNCSCLNCFNVKGENYLGRLLMLVRKECNETVR